MAGIVEEGGTIVELVFGILIAVGLCKWMRSSMILMYCEFKSWLGCLE